MIKIGHMDKPTDETVTESDYCSTRDAAELLGVSIKTAQSWVETGVLQAWKTPGGHRRIHRVSVTALLESRGAPPKGRKDNSLFSILAVDDEPAMRQLYEIQLGDWNSRARIETATSGFDALLRIGAHPPNVLITDLNMPGMDGFRMLRALRANRSNDALHIIIVTGMSATDIRDHGGLPNDITVFTKPLPFDRLKERLDGLIGKA